MVLSMTAKAYPESPIAGGLLTFSNTNETAYWEALEIWFHQTPSFVSNSTNNVQFGITKDAFLGFSLTLPNQNPSAVEALVTPFLTELDRLNILYNFTAFESASYAEHHVKAYGPLPYGNLCPSYVNLASRLIPRTTVLDPAANANLMSVYQGIVAGGDFIIGCSIINVKDVPAHPDNAVLPSWRDAIAYCNPQSSWDWTDPLGSIVAKNTLASQHFPAMEAATPGSGVYLNEIDPLYQGDWKETMYGVNYDRLLRIKRANDPYGLMYAHFAVGADEFTFDRNGRLCSI